MSAAQAPYNAISQGPATIPMDNYGEQRRITPAPQSWCNARRTKIIIAIVILTLLWFTFVIVWAVVKSKATATFEEELERAYDYHSHYHR